MQADSSLTLECTIPPAPKTVRGMPTRLDIANTQSGVYLLSANGPTISLRPLDAQSQFLSFTHKSDVLSFKFSPNGKYVSSIDEKGELVVHQIVKNKLIEWKRYEGFFLNARDMAWTHDSKKLCVVGESKKTYGRVIGVEMGNPVGQISGVSACLTAVGFQPVAPFALCAGGDQHVLKFYAGPPYKFASSLHPHTAFINQISYSPNGAYLVSVSSDRKIVILKDGKIIIQKQQAHNGGILGISWLENNGFITASADKCIKQWAIEDQELKEVNCWKNGTQQELKDAKNVGKFVVGVKYFNGSIYFIDLNGDISVVSLQAPSTTKYLGIRTKPIKILPISDNSCIILDSGSKILLYTLNPFQINQIVLPAGKFIADGQIIGNTLCIVMGDGSTAVIEDITSEQSIPAKLKYVQIPIHRVLPTMGRIIAKADKLFAFALSNPTSLLLINQSGQTLHSIAVNDDITTLYGWGEYVAAGNIKGKVYLYKLHADKLQQIATIEVGHSKITAIHAISNILHIGDSSGAIKLFQLSIDPVFITPYSSPLNYHSSLISGILSTSDGYLLTCGLDSKVVVWRIKDDYKRIDMQQVSKSGIIASAIVGNHIIISTADLLVRVFKLSIK